MEVKSLDAAVAAKTERLEKQHFDYTLVFGQGPVQEADRVPTTGREGLNFYSRLTALAAAEMLKAGITDCVIVSGGETGSRAGKPEAKTEAELMADVIRRHLTRGSTEPGIFTVGSKKRAISDAMKIENKAKDSLQNVAFILNTYLGGPSANNKRVAFLGIGFHAHDTMSGATEGRLEVLADLFGINAPVFSAEGVLRSIPVKSRVDKEGNVHLRSSDSFVAKTLTRSTNESLTHPVSILKSQQEAVLVRGLRAGDWLRIAPFLESSQRFRMVLRDPYVMNELEIQLNLSATDVQALSPEDVLDRIQKLRVTGSAGYGEVKAAVFQALEAMSRATGIDYLGKYGKSTVTY